MGIIERGNQATLESKVAPTNRNSSAFLLHTNKTFSNLELFSIFSQTFLELIIIKTNKILRNNVAEHLKYCSQINEY